jgi:Adaptin N terminal region
MPSNVSGIVDLCANTLLSFVEENDQNLKYLGLVGFGSLMQSHPHVLGDPKYRPIILSCLSDEDETIRSRALELCPSITTRKNLTELVGQLLQHVESASGSYKVELASKIIEMCSGDKYALLQDFNWYLGILFRLGHLSGVEQLGGLLRTQITDVALRVLPVRNVAVSRSMQVLLGESMYGSSKSEGKQAIDPILPALAWIVGEYSDYIREAIVEVGSKFDTAYSALVRQLTDVNKLSPETEKVFIQAALKVTAAAAADRLATNDEVEACILQLCHSLPIFAHSLDVEVASRAINALDILTMLGLHENGSSSAIKINSSDLLGIVSKGEEKEESTADNGDVRSLGERARACSSMFSYVVKGSSPMKPCGTKLQRKRYQADIGGGVSLTESSATSIFADLIREEMDLVRSTQMNIKSISFTRQVILQETTSQDPVQDVRQNYTFSDKQTATDKTDEIPKRRTDDPFYLAEAEDKLGMAQNKGAPRFGAIELLDSDNDEGESGKKPSKKAKKKKSRPFQQPMSVTMFDDDSDSDSGMRHDRRPGKEFAGLAKVDLTVPLDQPLITEKRLRKSGKKSAKKEKKKKSGKVAVTAEAVIGDLLDLSDMGIGQYLQPPAPSIADPIGAAFDSFSRPFPESQKMIATEFLPTDRLPWLKVVIKDQSSDIVVQKVELLSRLVRSTSTLQTLVKNESDVDIANVAVELKSPTVIINHGAIPSKREIQRETTVLISASECNRDVKGSIVVNGRSIPLKLRLPFAYTLLPDQKMSLQDLAVELAAPLWSSGSAKISLSRDRLSFQDVVETLQSFLSATVVDLATSTAALASRTADGSPVRFLLKMTKEHQLKIDVKAKETMVVDGIVADLKRVRL